MTTTLNHVEQGASADNGTAKPPRRRQQESSTRPRAMFHEQGYSTSIQEIAQAVGILKGSLYYYIRSKEDLLYAILQGVHADAHANIKRMETSRATPSRSSGVRDPPPHLQHREPDEDGRLLPRLPLAESEHPSRSSTRATSTTSCCAI